MENDEARKKQIRAMADKLCKQLADEGRIIQGGWLAYVTLSLQGASHLQLSEMRKAYFFGAQHLFGSIMSILEEGEDATEADLRRMDQIDQELKWFIKEVQK